MRIRERVCHQCGGLSLIGDTMLPLRHRVLRSCTVSVVQCDSVHELVWARSMRRRAHRNSFVADMQNLYMREVLMRELRTHRVSVDRLAAYLLVMSDTNVPCPRCYVRGLFAILVMVDSDDSTQQGVCERCSSTFSWRS